jgi:hypothetical protein
MLRLSTANGYTRQKRRQSFVLAGAAGTTTPGSARGWFCDDIGNKGTHAIDDDGATKSNETLTMRPINGELPRAIPESREGPGSAVGYY